MSQASKFDQEKCRQLVGNLFRQSAVPSLMDYIKIPNLSRLYDPEWASNGLLEKAAEHMRQWALGQAIDGLSSEVIKDQGYSPIIYTQIKGTLPTTVLFYSHFDKQPPFVGWRQGLEATKPVIEDGKLYGRGGADDGYAFYSSLIAIKALQVQNVPLPRCILLTQGDQQSRSIHMQHYLPKLRQRIGDPKLLFCLDSGCGDYQRLWTTTSLRGNYVATLRVETLTSDVHSGTFSGSSPSCFRIARILLSRIQDPTTGELNAALRVHIPPESYAKCHKLAQERRTDYSKEFPFVGHAKPIHSDPLKSMLARGWQPAMTIIGQSGFPRAQVAGSVLLTHVELKFTLRLPPTLNAQQAAATIERLLLKDIPYNAKVTLKNPSWGNGWSAPPISKELSDSLENASKKFYGKDLLSLSQGASIPLINRFSQCWPKSQMIIVGVLGPHSNAHGPNEFLHLGYTEKLICSMACVLAAMGQVKE